MTYRGPMTHLAITGVSHIELRCTDLEASAAWYETAVGLRPLQAAPGRYAVLTPERGGFRVGLTEKDPAEVRAEFGHLAIAVESMDALHSWIEHLDAIGVEHTPLKENPFTPGVFSIDLFDPDGHEIELIYEP